MHRVFPKLIPIDFQFFVFDKSTTYVQNIIEVAKATTKNIVQSNVSNEQSDLEFGYIFKIMHHSPAE